MIKNNTMNNAMMNLAERILNTVGTNNNPSQICFQDIQITGQEIISRSLSLAASLKDMGFMPGQRVLLIMKDTPEFVFGFIALIANGCIPVPLNPKIEEDVLDYILHDSRAAGALVDGDEFMRYKDILSASSYISASGVIINETDNYKAAGIMTLSELIDMGKIKAGSFSYYRSKPHSIAFWQYTSGTTGRPKAVQHSQETMLLNTENFAVNTLGITKTDRVVSIPKMFFGYGLGNSLFFPLLTGASVLLDHEWPSLNRVQQSLSVYKPTVFFGVPKIYSLLLNNRSVIDQRNLHGVRLYFSAGSHLPETLNNEWMRWTGKHVVNGIGCTEIGHVFLCNKPGSVSPKLSGWPVTGYTTKVTHLEDPERELPAGEIGELSVKSPYMPGKYWENETDNDRKFRHGWYYTGDLCVKDDEGGYTFLGRKDNLFKINGRWVNPEEVESKILTLFNVEECALVEMDDDSNLSIPVLFVVKRGKEAIDIGVMKKELSKHLPGFKCPQNIIPVDELPRNANGKVSRNAIRQKYAAVSVK